jgi:alcohol dehydrogenase class IV
MSTAQLAENEFPARTALKDAQERLVAALAAADAAAQSLARGKEHFAVLERLRDEARAEIVDEARTMAETFAENGVVAMIGGSAQRVVKSMMSLQGGSARNLCPKAWLPTQ